MDLSILVPTLTRFGAPMLAELFETAATATGGPLAGMAVTGISNFVLSKLGAAFNAPSDDPAAISQAVETAAQADPVATQAKLQQVQDDHASLIQQAITQAQIDEQNVENARATEVARHATGTWYERAAPLVLGIIIVIGFFGIMTLFGLGKASSSDTIMVVLATTMASAFGALVNYYFGSSIGSKTKTDMIAAGLPPAKRVVR